jgi:hypothetical protein
MLSQTRQQQAQQPVRLESIGSLLRHKAKMTINAGLPRLAFVAGSIPDMPRNIKMLAGRYG